MPYIDQKIRDVLDESVKNPESPGELNYMFTRIMIQYIKDYGLNYQHINDVLGALDGAAKEFYRRVAVPYEDGKIKSAGDVYPNEF
jgi:hypothetical protein